MTLFNVLSRIVAFDVALAHVPEWNELANEETTKAEVWIGCMSEDDIPSAPEAVDWSDMIQQGQADRRYIALVDDRSSDLVGAMVLKCYPCDSDELSPGVLVELAIVPAERGKGIGSAALGELAHWLLAIDSDLHIFADVCTTNTGSLRMLARAGWSQTGADGDCFLDGRPLHDCDKRSTRLCVRTDHP